MIVPPSGSCSSIGIGVSGYQPPADILPAQRPEWLIGEFTRLNLDVVPLQTDLFLDSDGRYDVEAMRRVRARADAAGLAIEPSMNDVFELASHDKTKMRRARDGLRSAALLGGPYVGAAYGRGSISTSRFSSKLSLKDHLAMLTTSLQVAAQIAEEEGVVIAMENHCDFRGSELAQILRDVGSPNVRARLDTGNAFTVFSDPADDIRILAPWAVMIHLKDMLVEPNTNTGLPFRAVSCLIGDGHFDIVEAIKLVFTHGERGTRIPLIAEATWLPNQPGVAASEKKRAVLLECAKRIRTIARALETSALDANL